MESLQKPKRLEPYFTLIEEESCFKVICTTVDNSQRPMRGDKLVIEKKGCVIYTSCKYTKRKFCAF